MAEFWKVIYRSDSLPLGETGAEGLSEADSVAVYEKFEKRCRKTGGSVQLLKNGEVVASFTVEGETT